MSCKIHLKTKRKEGPGVMEMEGRICKPFPKGITSQPWAHSEEGEGDEAGKFWGRKTTTQHFPRLYIILVDLSGSLFPFFMITIIILSLPFFSR